MSYSVAHNPLYRLPRLPWENPFQKFSVQLTPLTNESSWLWFIFTFFGSGNNTYLNIWVTLTAFSIKKKKGRQNVKAGIMALFLKQNSNYIWTKISSWKGPWSLQGLNRRANPKTGGKTKVYMTVVNTLSPT